MLGGQPNHGWQFYFPLLLHTDGSNFRLYDGSNLKTYLLMRWKGPDALAVCWAHRGLPVGFLLLWYSVLFTVESLSLLYLLVISWFICSRRWCIDKLGVFHANQISMCLDPHLNYGWGRCRETGLNPPVNYFTDRSKGVLLLWIFYAFSVLCLLCLCARRFICALSSPAGKGLTSWLSFVVSNC